MSCKSDLLKFLDESYEQKYEYFTVLIDTENSNGYELIVNPMCNYETKRAYYDKAYDDDLILKSFSGIRIIDYDACMSQMELGDLFLDKERMNGER